MLLMLGMKREKMRNLGEKIKNSFVNLVSGGVKLGASVDFVRNSLYFLPVFIQAPAHAYLHP